MNFQAGCTVGTVVCASVAVPRGTVCLYRDSTVLNLLAMATDLLGRIRDKRLSLQKDRFLCYESVKCTIESRFDKWTYPKWMQLCATDRIHLRRSDCLSDTCTTMKSDART